MSASISIHDVELIEIKEDSLFSDEDGNATSYVTDIIINSGRYGETTISLFSSDKSKPITINRKV
jgi:hypothetical protein